MVSREEFIQHYRNLYKTGAIYVWGANGQTITKELTDSLYRSFGSARYNKAYYDGKYREGKGKIGADCSGSIYPLSHSDNTARGYYNACPAARRGSISNMKMDQPCLIFNSSFTHVGAYLGDGTTIEMMSSARNCVKQEFNRSRWAYYGVPSWLNVAAAKPEPTASKHTTNKIKPNVKKAVIKNYQKWLNSFVGKNMTVDGVYGSKTKKISIMAIQKILNELFGADLKVDGEFGQQTKAACVSASRDKRLTYIVQAYLLQAGYDVSGAIKSGDTLNMNYGRGTKAAVTDFQKDTKGLRHDGECGPATFYAMFK